jgi:hypothetical protein
MTTNLKTLQASITTLTIDGITITRDIARQLDELRYPDWEKFEPLGRVRTGMKYFDEGIELLGRYKETGALVRMWHLVRRTTKYEYVPRTTPDGRIHMDPVPLPPDDLRDTLTDEYSRLPLIVLPKDCRE